MREIHKPIAIDDPGRLSVCMSVCHTDSLCKHGWKDRGPVLGGDIWGRKNVVLDGSFDFVFVLCICVYA